MSTNNISILISYSYTYTYNYTYTRVFVGDYKLNNKIWNLKFVRY